MVCMCWSILGVFRIFYICSWYVLTLQFDNKALAIKFNKANDLLFVGYPLLNLAGTINSYGIYGFTFFFPNYQSLIFGLATSSSQISGLIAYVLEFMVKANISLWLVHVIFGI